MEYGKNLPLVIFLFSLAIFQVFYIVRMFLWIGGVTCRKCKSVYSYMKESTANVQCYEHEEAKTVGRNARVGEVFLNDKKVGDVYQKQYDQYTRKVKGYVEDVNCRCIYCGEKRVFNDGHSFYSDWQ